MADSGLAQALDSIAEGARAHLATVNFGGPSTGVEEAFSALAGSIEQDFKLDIKNGKGSVTESKRTFGVTIKGTFEVTAPDSGTWHLVAKVDGTTVVDKRVSKGEKVPFTAKTSFWSPTKVQVNATWSEGGDTTLVVHLKATY